LSNSTLIPATGVVETVTETASEDAFAAATVEASMTLKLAAPASVPVIEQRIPLVAV